MYKDPVVAEVRKAREELAIEADNDLEKFLANLRLAQDKYGNRLSELVAVQRRPDTPSER